MKAMSFRTTGIAAIAAFLVIALSVGGWFAMRKPPTTTLTVGMPMTTAISEMEKRWLTSVTMAYPDPHQAFDLPDGRTVILVGGNSVDAIEVIANAR